MKDQIPISALAITLNEEKNIDGFIKSLWFADEIVIVDSFSTDDTVSRASAYPNVTVHQRKFDNFSSQKNFAISKATHDWVVFFDPDEEIDEAMGKEIQQALVNPEAVAYAVKRTFYFMGRRIKYSGLQNDWVVRVFNRNNCKYNKNLVHEVLEAEGTTARLRTLVPHHTYSTFDAYTAKMHRYSKLQAEMMYKKGKRPTLFHFLIRPWYRFWHQYLIRLGILDGKEGFILAYISGFSVFKRYVNLWLLYRKID